jgi:hypothetical protein
MRRLFLVAPLLLACTATARSVSSARITAAAASEAPCVGDGGGAPEGATAVDDPALLARAIGAEGAGKLCAGAVFEAARPITVYRVWQRDRAYTELGRWWSLERPAGPREAYRARNAVCPEWSALDAWSRCELRVGARFVVGPGQSARCEGGATIPRSATRQVYVDNDTREGRVFVERCENQGVWPPPP